MTDTQDSLVQQERLQKERTQILECLKSAIECAGDLVLIHDTDLKNICWSRAVEEFTGYSGEEIARGDALMFMPEEEQDVVRAGAGRVFEGETVHIASNWCRKKDGSLGQVSTVGSPVKDSDGKVIACFIIARDITEQVKLEQDIRRTKDYLENVITSANDAIHIVDTEERLVMANKKSLEIAGLRLEDVVGKKVVESAVIPEDRPLARKGFEAALRGEFTSVEARTRHPDGRILTFSARSAPIYEDGKVVGVMTIARDITEQKNADEKLRSSENKYRTLLENLPQKIFFKDKNSVYISCNEHLARDLNITPDEIAGKTDYDFFHKELAEKYRTDDEKIMKSGRTEDIEEEYIQDGQNVSVHTVKTPVRDGNGNIVGILGIFWDVTERKKAQEALRESEERYRTLFESASEGILLADSETREFKYANLAICIMLGYGEEELRGMTVSDIHPEEALGYAISEFEAIVRGEKALALGVPYLRKDGEIIYADITATRVSIHGKEYTVGFFRDITERRRNEEEIRYLNEYLESLIDSSPVAIYSLDEDLRVQTWSSLMREGTGISKEDALGKHIADIFPQAADLGWLQKIQEVLKTGESFVATDYRIALEEQESGEEIARICNIHIAPIKDRKGETHGVIVITDDVTQRKRLEEQLIHSAKLASLGQLAAGVAHEINNPLSALSGTIQMLMERHEGTDGFHKHLVMLRKLARRIGKTVDGLLFFSSQKTGKEEWAGIEINHVVEDSVSLVSTHLGRGGIRLATDYAANLPNTYGVAGDLQQVFMNLILNAQDAMPDGGSLRVSTTVKDDGATLEASFEDTGCGIPEENLDRIFTPFFSTKGPGKGTGLGLSVSHGIITRHDGTITVESELGAGSRFVVSLPVRREA